MMNPCVSLRLNFSIGNFSERKVSYLALKKLILSLTPALQS